MRKEARIKAFKTLHDDLNDPERMEEAQRIAERNKRKAERQADTGL